MFMDQRFEDFLALSVILTGFSRWQLLGTAMAATYLSTLDESLPGGVLDDLLSAYRQLPQGAERDAAIASGMLADARLGPVVRNLILLWYRGFWSALPSDWHNAYGAASHTDNSGYVSAMAYQSGLQWIAAGAHPPGSSQEGFGSWSVLPERSGL
jgi:hypothetical protein